jgi:formate dehydrogenase subunit delta
MSHATIAEHATEHGHGGEHLVKMANDIAHFYAGFLDAAEGRREAAGHLRKFWAAPMRRAFFEHLAEHGDGGLEPFMAEAVREHQAYLQGGTGLT